MKQAPRSCYGRAAAAAALMAALLGACASPQQREEELQATWREAKVYMPKDGGAVLVYRGAAASWPEAVVANGAKPSQQRVPAVLHLHGCRGFDGSDPRLGAFYASQGFAYFGPNSFARANRTALCNKGRMGARIAMRMEEARHALARIREIEWIDPTRIVLSGFSEGAQAASAYSGRDFAAVVLLGTDCRFVGHRPQAPSEVPVLNIVGSDDHFGYGSGCAPHGARSSRNLVIRDGQHDVSLDEQARQALAEFLSAVRR